MEFMCAWCVLLAVVKDHCQDQPAVAPLYEKLGKGGREVDLRLTQWFIT